MLLFLPSFFKRLFTSAQRVMGAEWLARLAAQAWPISHGNGDALYG